MIFRPCPYPRQRRFIVLAAIGLALVSRPVEADRTPRILLVGDSWAYFMWQERSLSAALADHGLAEFEERGARTAIAGTRASEWARPERLQLLTDELSALPTVDIVQLTVGGNDLQERVSPSEIVSNIEVVVDHILGLRGDIRVLLVGYDYLPGTNLPVTARQMNNFMARFEQKVLELAQSKERVEYLLDLGLMQATFGFPPHFDAGEVPLPGAPPDYAPFLGGDPDRWSPPLTYRDSLHLTRDGYVALCSRAIGLFYEDWLSGGTPQFLRGDSNGDGLVDIADPIRTLEVLFIGEGELNCGDAADANDDGALDVSDAITTLGVLFLGQGDIPAPGTDGCGVDPNDDRISCHVGSECG